MSVLESSNYSKQALVTSTEVDDGATKYGVRNYLHHFYDDCSGIELCERGQMNYEELEQQRRCRWIIYAVVCFAGLCILSLGLVLLVTGILESPSNASITYGAACISVGGIFMTASLVATYLELIKRKQEIMEQKHFQERCKHGMTMNRNNSSNSSTLTMSSDSTITSSPDLPLSLYAVTPIQPSSESPCLVNDSLRHVVMSKADL